jgi:hypothetical protein
MTSSASRRAAPPTEGKVPEGLGLADRRDFLTGLALPPEKGLALEASLVVRCSPALECCGCRKRRFVRYRDTPADQVVEL